MVLPRRCGECCQDGGATRQITEWTPSHFHMATSRRNNERLFGWSGWLGGNRKPGCVSAAAHSGGVGRRHRRSHRGGGRRPIEHSLVFDEAEVVVVAKQVNQGPVGG